MSFIYLKRNCPICAGARTDCRQSATGLIHCRDTEASPTGFTLVGVDAIGFSMWADKTISAASEEQQEQWRREREAQKQQRLKEERERRAAALTEKERDTEIRKILGQLDLKPSHRENLRRRGLSDAQIDAGDFRSVGDWHPLEEPVSSRLAGVDLDGRRLITYAGYLCFTRNGDGLFTGWQLKTDNPEKANGKYKWPSSKTKKRPNSPTVHLPNGEWPLQIARPVVSTNTSVGLCEGILKPWIAAHLSGQTFIGAAGGQFLQSRQQLLEALFQLQATTVTLYPDHDGVSNRQVFHRDCGTVKFLQEHGFEVKVANWGQLRDSDALDIDQLWAAGRGAEIRYLSAKTYLALPKEPTEKNWAVDYTSRCRQEWERLSSLSQPTETRRERYLDINVESLLPGAYAIKSPMGTGKTELLKRICRHFPQGNVFAMLNSILQQTANKVGELEFLWDIELGVDDPALETIYLRTIPWVAACVHSCRRLEAKDVLVVEECASTLKCLLSSSTTRRNRAELIADFRYKLQNAKWVFFMDADMSDIECSYLSEVLGKPITKITNEGQGQPWDVHMLMGTHTIAGDGKIEKTLPNDSSPLIAQAIGMAGSGEPFLWVGDSQTGNEVCAKLFDEAGISGLVVDSTTKTDNPEINDFLRDPNNWIERNHPSYITLSPTALASLDITIPWFKAVFGYFHGVLDGFGCRQMLGRYREPVPRYVFCRQFLPANNTGIKSPVASVVAKNLHKLGLAEILEIGLADYLANKGAEEENTFDLVRRLAELTDPENPKWKSPELNMYCAYTARENYQKANLRTVLKELLEKAGHRVHEYWATHERTAYGETRKTVIEMRSQAIATAPDIDIKQARAILESLSSSQDERRAAQKALLRERLPGLELTADFVKHVLFDCRYYLDGLQRYWMLQHPGVQEELDRRSWEYQLAADSPAWDYRCNAFIIRTLQDTGILTLCGGQFTKISPEVIAVRDRAVTIAGKLRLIGVTARPDSEPMTLCRRLAEHLGLTVIGKQRRTGTTRQRFYTFARPETDERAAAILSAYDRRWASLLAQIKTVRASQPDLNKEISLLNSSETTVTEPVSTWRGLLCRLRAVPDQALGLMRERYAELETRLAGLQLKVDSHFPHLLSDAATSAVYVQFTGGCVSVPVNWLEFELPGEDTKLPPATPGG
jgi:hypothetical protein